MAHNNLEENLPNWFWDLHNLQIEFLIQLNFQDKSARWHWQQYRIYGLDDDSVGNQEENSSFLHAAFLHIVVVLLLAHHVDLLASFTQTSGNFASLNHYAASSKRPPTLFDAAVHMQSTMASQT